MKLLKRQDLRELLCWRVKTAEGNGEACYARTLEDLREEHSSREKLRIPIFVSKDLSQESEQPIDGRNTPQEKESVASLRIDEASSQHLLQVRERLGDLCEWPSESLESAKSLVHSVEAFMDTFFPKTVTSFDWIVETIGLSTERGSGQCDFVSIPVQRIKGKWNVGIGVIDAILSLWMAGIEAEAAYRRTRPHEEHANNTSGQKLEEPNWRWRKSGIDLRYDFRRILGDDLKDGTLKRDLSWWVSETIIEQSEEKRHSSTALVTGTTLENANPKSVESRFSPSSAKQRGEPFKLIIGFNGLTRRRRF